MIKEAFNGLRTAWKGLALTLKHFGAASESKKVKGINEANYFGQQAGIATVQYPHQKLPVPEVGRYQLDVVIDDCIVCDLCAKICPVDCIDIESIKATDVIGKTSDGSVKRLYAPKFDIDMAKCMYCGLCTTVCPTECIIMTAEYDKSVTHISDLNYKFASMTDAEAAQKRLELEQQLAERQAAKAAALKKMEEDK
ncbi:4Fe-4S dicluster domain-containing protein [Pedobacter sp. SD-b]|uniref:4Fe-4S dicluster domain-containing protein n=1 Tax=Pedobacter segetis TaxID=2793069 RepID=A0ABS1BIY0_9SPHI|nr:4Fe-4S binding protein [Pedobacter segetis]MBK0382814.1 4Fe-4S dicluster domain-containing protein [Pedobacter segetis]